MPNPLIGQVTAFIIILLNGNLNNAYSVTVVNKQFYQGEYLIFDSNSSSLPTHTSTFKSSDGNNSTCYAKVYEVSSLNLSSFATIKAKVSGSPTDHANGAWAWGDVKDAKIGKAPHTRIINGSSYTGGSLLVLDTTGDSMISDSISCYYKTNISTFVTNPRLRLYVSGWASQ